ncbi:MAG: hypothetical protein ACXW0U_07285, partial [Halobacteriota archaeon]
MKLATFNPRIKGNVILIIIVIALLITAGWYYYYQDNASTQSASSAEVLTEVVRRGDLTLSASGTGTLIAQTDASFGFETNGQVTHVYIKVGDEVEAGRVLAQLDNNLAQMEYVEAQQD